MNKHSKKVYRALIVEDEPSIAEMCRRILSIEGFEIDIAPDGGSAKEMLTRKQYNVYLIDIRMPKVNGKELYEWLNNNHPHLACRVIFTSGDIMSGDSQEFIEKSQKPFLSKPFNSSQLVTAVFETLKIQNEVADN